MGNGSSGTCSFSLTVLTGAVVVLGLMAIPALAQRTVQRDPAEPAQGQPNPQPKLLARPAGGVPRQAVDEKSMRLENVYAILPGSDPKLAKTIFIVSGHFDSRPSNVMDPNADAPGADDDA